MANATINPRQIPAIMAIMTSLRIMVYFIVKIRLYFTRAIGFGQIV